MRNAVAIWTGTAARYRWFVGFGIAWLGIVTTVTPALTPAVEDLVGAPQRPSAAVRGTLGAVSSPTTSAADALRNAQGYDSTAGPVFDEPASSIFDGGPSFDGFDSSGEEPQPEPEPEAPTGGPAPPPACTTDSSLPVPVATTVVGTVAGIQGQLGSTTGQPLPADPAGTIGSALGCSGSGATGSAGDQAAPSLSNGISVDGLTPAALLRILFGL